jgi:hypothetical protein
MPYPLASTEPASADWEPPGSEVSSRPGKSTGDGRARMIALVVGMLVGTFIGIGIGVRVGNAVRKRVDRWSPCYLCGFSHATCRVGVQGCRPWVLVWLSPAGVSDREPVSWYPRPPPGRCALLHLPAPLNRAQPRGPGHSEKATDPGLWRDVTKDSYLGCARA